MEVTVHIFSEKENYKKEKQKDGSETKMIVSFLKQDLNTETVGKTPTNFNQTIQQVY